MQHGVDALRLGTQAVALGILALMSVALQINVLLPVAPLTADHRSADQQTVPL